jgi:hypothetical protein
LLVCQTKEGKKRKKEKMPLNLPFVASLCFLALFGPAAFIKAGPAYSTLWTVIGFALTAVSVLCQAALCDNCSLLMSAYRATEQRRGSMSKQQLRDDTKTNKTKKKKKVNATHKGGSDEEDEKRVINDQVTMSRVASSASPLGDTIRACWGCIPAAFFDLFLVLYLTTGNALRLGRSGAAIHYFVRSLHIDEWNVSVEAASLLTATASAAIFYFLSSAPSARAWLVSASHGVTVATTALVLLLVSSAMATPGAADSGALLLGAAESSMHRDDVLTMWPAVSGVLLSYSFSFQKMTTSTRSRGGGGWAHQSSLSVLLDMTVFAVVYVGFSVAVAAALPHTPHPLKLLVFSFLEEKSDLPAAFTSSVVVRVACALLPMLIALATAGSSAKLILDICANVSFSRSLLKSPTSSGQGKRGFLPTGFVVGLCGWLVVTPSVKQVLGPAWGCCGCLLHVTILLTYAMRQTTNRITSQHRRDHRGLAAAATSQLCTGYGLLPVAAFVCCCVWVILACCYIA